MVIERNGEKYACRQCIRGHRVKKCQHVDRPLVLVQKRGRQISQCNHCRHLRVTKRSHVKCTCAVAASPNPLNGCLCEMIHNCTCVASHLQDTSDSPSPIPESPSTL
ncbi:hypothetical protein VTP01DRAFT_4374 [Rhizomucor pusillus]|uniref:uncharacterized protein n=1 Tax=Rhizomucor pusillus TaxID=4840 RepID=UPI0037425F41